MRFIPVSRRRPPPWKESGGLAGLRAPPVQVFVSNLVAFTRRPEARAERWDGGTVQLPPDVTGAFHPGGGGRPQPRSNGCVAGANPRGPSDNSSHQGRCVQTWHQPRKSRTPGAQ
jgi:hypothetical protein